MWDAVGIEEFFDEVREIGVGVRCLVSSEDPRQFEDGRVPTRFGAPGVLRLTAIFRPLTVSDHCGQRRIQRWQLREDRMLWVQGQQSFIYRLADFPQRLLRSLQAPKVLAIAAIERSLELREIIQGLADLIRHGEARSAALTATGRGLDSKVM